MLLPSLPTDVHVEYSFWHVDRRRRKIRTKDLHVWRHMFLRFRDSPLLLGFPLLHLSQWEVESEPLRDIARNRHPVTL